MSPMRDAMSLEQMRDICARFELGGPVTGAAPYGSGHIHDTYAVTVSEGGASRRFILQRINHGIFRDVPRLMENIARVTDHLRRTLGSRAGADPARETLTVVPTRDGGSFFRTDSGDCWRAYDFIEGCRTVDVVEVHDQAYEAASAFGRFQRLLADLPAPPLHEILPRFHDTPWRFENLESAIAADTCGRRKDCGPEIEFAMARKAMTDTVTRGLASGAIPTRVTHNDTKINNVLLDAVTGRGVAVIDLDTVMPGSILYDFGDQIRSSVGHFVENERDLGKIYVDLDRFEALARGYLASARAFLTPAETELLAFSGRLITFEIGLRFLTDYLQGDVYFRTHRPGENLDRCRTQFAFVRSQEQHRDEMERIVGRCL